MKDAERIAEREAVEVVGYRVSMPGEPELGSWLDEEAESEPQIQNHEPLMTVAQHERILSAWQRTQANAERLLQQEEQARRDDAGHNLRELFKRGAAALGLEPDETSWFEIVGELEKLAAAPAAAQDQPEVQRLREALEEVRSYITSQFLIDRIDAALAASTGQEVGK